MKERNEADLQNSIDYVKWTMGIEGFELDEQDIANMTAVYWADNPEEEVNRIISEIKAKYLNKNTDE